MILHLIYVIIWYIIDIICQMTEKLAANDGQLTDELLELLKTGMTNGFLQLDEEIRVILNKVCIFI